MDDLLFQTAVRFRDNMVLLMSGWCCRKWSSVQLCGRVWLGKRCYDIINMYDVWMHWNTVLLCGDCSHRGWLAGYQMALDTAKTAKSLLSQSNFAIGYCKDDLTLHTAVW